MRVVNMRVKVIGLLLISGCALIACNGGSNATSTSLANTSSTKNTLLGKYISSLNYSATRKASFVAAGNTQQQTMQVTTALVLESISINFYNSNDCTGSSAATVELTGPVAVNPGDYTTSNASSFNICQAYPGGCASEWAPSYAIQFVYTTTTTTIMGGCSNVVAPGPSGWNVIGTSSSNECSNTSDCGFTVAYTDSI